jgi:predicted nucleic acid-binding protein
LSGFLLDTNVVSMLSPARTDASPRFLDWLERVDREGRVFLSVVAIHEIEKGVALLEHKGATAKAAGLKIWLAGLVATYGMADAALDGVASAHGLTIITHNTKHFLPFGVGVATPDEAVQFD